MFLVCNKAEIDLYPSEDNVVLSWFIFSLYVVAAASVARLKRLLLVYFISPLVILEGCSNLQKCSASKKIIAFFVSSLVILKGCRNLQRCCTYKKIIAFFVSSLVILKG